MILILELEFKKAVFTFIMFDKLEVFGRIVFKFDLLFELRQVSIDVNVAGDVKAVLMNIRASGAHGSKHGILTKCVVWPTCKQFIPGVGVTHFNQ
jgi:hypothetical protein